MNSKKDIAAIASLFIAILTLLFGDNVYQQITGHSFYSSRGGNQRDMIASPTVFTPMTAPPKPTTVMVPTISAPPVVAKPTDSHKPTVASTNDEFSIIQLVLGESEAFMQRDIDRLEAMWASDGVEVDMNGTSTPSDDKIWKGWAAIRERYTTEFKYSYSVENTNVRVTIAGDSATAVSDLKFNGTLLKDQDKWTFRKIVGGQWKITSLTFGFPK